MAHIKYNARSAAKRRADHATENAQDYVELIGQIQQEMGAAHVTDIARRLGVSHVTVHKTIKRLKALGLVNAIPYRAISLTEEGRAMAEESRYRHEVTLRFLRALGVSEGSALNDAEGLEHHVGTELLERMHYFCEQMKENGKVTGRELQQHGRRPGESEEEWFARVYPPERIARFAESEETLRLFWGVSETPESRIKRGEAGRDGGKSS